MHVDDRRGDVDEPVGQERRDAQEDDVERQVLVVLGDLFGPLLDALGEVALNERPAEAVGKQIAERRADRGALRRGDWKKVM